MSDHFAQIDNPINHRFSLGRIGIEVQGIGDRVDPVVENLIDGLVDNNLKIVARDNTGLSDSRPHTAGDLDPAGDAADKSQVSCRIGDGDDVETRCERGANRWREGQAQLVTTCQAGDLERMGEFRLRHRVSHSRRRRRPDQPAGDQLVAAVVQEQTVTSTQIGSNQRRRRAAATRGPKEVSV